MKRQTLILAITAIAACGFAPIARGQSSSSPSDFASQIDIATFGRLAVHSEGRVKSFDSHARALMQLVTGPRKINGQSPLVTYLDLMLRPEAYADVDLLFVKNKQMRADISRVLSESMQIDAANVPSDKQAVLQQRIAALEPRLAGFLYSGLIAESMLNDPRVQALLAERGANVLTTAKFVQMLETAGNVMQPDTLRMNLRFVPPLPPEGGFDDPWTTLDEHLGFRGGMPSEQVIGRIIEQLSQSSTADPTLDQGFWKLAQLALPADAGAILAEQISQQVQQLETAIKSNDLQRQKEIAAAISSRAAPREAIERTSVQVSALLRSLVDAQETGDLKAVQRHETTLAHIQIPAQIIADLQARLVVQSNAIGSSRRDGQVEPAQNALDGLGALASRAQLAEHWLKLIAAWQAQDATAVNAAAAQLAVLLPAINPEIYPNQNRLAWESWYFTNHNMTWVWLIYAFALVPLLLSIVFKWRAARWIGLLMFLVAFGFQTFAVMLRWYVAQRWPNSNMFEAVTTAAWFGGCCAIILELLVGVGSRRSAMRNLFALGSATASATALMAVHFLPLELTPNISNRMPVLNDIWLYIHTNVIIFSYCLIFMAAVIATVYLGYRVLGALGGWQARAEYARVGGAGSLILTRPDGTSYMDDSGEGVRGAGDVGAGGRSTFGQVLDGTTMVMMELSFILLWTGLVMGAIWADHSWGRPWGWDPKEVFALNTFIIFLLLVHVRLKVKDKGLWTAILAVIGAGVMLFNWIIINFAISGLHSYA